MSHSVALCPPPTPECVHSHVSFFLPVAVGTAPPRITGPNLEQVTAIVNSSVALSCEVHAHPSPEVTWYRDSQALSLGKEVFLQPGG